MNERNEYMNEPMGCDAYLAAAGENVYGDFWGTCTCVTHTNHFHTGYTVIKN